MHNPGALFVNTQHMGHITQLEFQPLPLISRVLSLPLRYDSLSIKCWSRWSKTDDPPSELHSFSRFLGHFPQVYPVYTWGISRVFIPWGGTFCKSKTNTKFLGYLGVPETKNSDLHNTLNLQYQRFCDRTKPLLSFLSPHHKKNMIAMD